MHRPAPDVILSAQHLLGAVLIGACSLAVASTTGCVLDRPEETHVASKTSSATWQLANTEPDLVRFDSLASHGTRLSLSLSRWGRARNLHAVPTVRKRFTNTHRVELDRGTLDEWYDVNGDRIAQGFYLRERPPGTSPLSLELETSGLVIAHSSSDRAILRDRRGSRVHVDGLLVLDARHNEIPARFASSGDTLRIEVDDSSAEYPLFVDPIWTAFQEDNILALDGTTGDAFGALVRAESDTIVVGSDSRSPNNVRGSFYIYDRTPGGWSYTQKISDPVSPFIENFANTLDISGDRIVVGQYRSAQIYERSGSGSGIWSLVGGLSTTDVESAGGFGDAVAIDGDTIIVGAPRDQSNDAGSAFAFEYDSITSSWVESQILPFPVSTTSDMEFGRAIDISGDFAIIGAPGEESVGFRMGAAYIFHRRSLSNWRAEKKLTALDGVIGDGFGTSVAISQNLVLVGVPNDQDRGAGAGAVYVYEKGTCTSCWTYATQLYASDGSAGQRFGQTVATSGDVIVVGAKEAVYVFTREQTSGAWRESSKITTATALDSRAFGASVAVTGDTIVVGAPDDPQLGEDAGSLYIYERIERCSIDQDCESGTLCDPFSLECEPTDTCGNGVVEGAERCDDGEALPGDGCGATCLLENGYACAANSDCSSSTCTASGTCACQSDASCEPDHLCLATRPMHLPRGFVCAEDTDNDGLTDDEEARLGSSASSSDTDGDGVADISEVSPGALALDTDDDGVPDHLDADDDDDGVSTLDEGPDADVDADGIPDYLDADEHDGPLADLDGDGLTNQMEAEAGTSPAETDSDGDGVCDGALPAPGCIAGPDPKLGARCLPGYSCDAPTGATCSVDDECQSGQCQDEACVAEPTAPPAESEPLVLHAPEDGSSSFLNTRVIGTSDPSTAIRVIVNGADVAVEPAPRRASVFFFDIPLEQGVNLIEVRSTTDQNETSLMRTVTVSPSPLYVGEEEYNPDEPVSLVVGDTLSGEATPGMNIVVDYDGERVCQTTTDAQGQWSCTLDSPRENGTLVIQDSDGNTLGTLDAQVLPGAAPAKDQPDQRGGCSQVNTTTSPSLLMVFVVCLLVGMRRKRTEE